MNWKYFIPHKWDSDQATWEDIYLRPMEKPHEKALCVSINSKRMITIEELLREEELQWRRDILAYLNRHSYLIEGSEMYVSREAFDLDQLLKFAKIYLESKGFKDPKLFEGSYEEVIEEVEKDYKKVL